MSIRSGARSGTCASGSVYAFDPLSFDAWSWASSAFTSASEGAWKLSASEPDPYAVTAPGGGCSPGDSATTTRGCGFSGGSDGSACAEAERPADDCVFDPPQPASTAAASSTAHVSA